MIDTSAWWYSGGNSDILVIQEHRTKEVWEAYEQWVEGQELLKDRLNSLSYRIKKSRQDKVYVVYVQFMLEISGCPFELLYKAKMFATLYSL